MYQLLQFIRRLIPAPALDVYHRTLSWVAALWYGDPSQKMVVIGVTGTSGKTTTAYLTAKLLEADGSKTGMMSTAFFKVADRVWENRTKMTMLGRFQTQKLLREMLNAGCRYVVVETTSQGIVQHRHEHIAYDIVMLTNLWPEHVEAHGSFAAYKRAKQQLFVDVAKLPRKTLNGSQVPRVEILNAESEHAKDFVFDGYERIVWFGHDADVSAEHIEISLEGSQWSVRDLPVSLHLPGTVNIDNALAALSVVDALGIPFARVTDRLSAIGGLPGRYERVDLGQPFTVIVDYAFEPGAVAKIYELVSIIPHQRIIHVLGSTGGGRDVARRAVLGGMAGKNADIAIVTNEDPYDDDPMTIINQVADGAAVAGKQDGVDLFRIEDRADAIRQAIALAQPEDIVLITGKGSEPVMAVAGGQKIPWSDVEEVKKAIQATLKI